MAIAAIVDDSEPASRSKPCWVGDDSPVTITEPS